MSGVMTSATRATPRTPPSTTTAVRTTSRSAAAQTGTPCEPARVAEIVLACTIGIATAIEATRRKAKTVAHRREPRPRWM